MNARLPWSAPVTNYEPPTPPDLSQYDTIYLDTETTGVSWARGDRPIGIAVGTPDGKRWYLPFGHEPGGNLDEALVRRWAVQELRGKAVVGLHLKFDLHMLRVWGCDLREQACTFHDIAHAEALLDDHARGFGLDAIAQRRLGLGKLDVGPKDTLAYEHAGTVAPYAERDVELPHLIDELQRPLLTAEGLDRVMALEDSLIPVVVEMEANGAPLDMDLLERWERSSAKLLERMHHDLYKLVGFTVNPDAPTDMSRLFLKCGEPVRRTAAGRASFTTDIVQDAAVRHPEIALVWRIGKLTDLRTKYLVKYGRDQVNGVIYPSFNQLMTDEGGTVSGRFSCVRPNLQQVMGADKHGRMYGWLAEYGEDDYLIKRLFRPANGTWLAADAKQIEYRLFAHYADSPAILGKYAANPETDFHNIVRDLVITARPEITRTEVKTFNFLKIYGGGIGAASRNLNVDPGTAQEISDAYDAQFPEARELLGRAMRLAERRGYVKTLLGRRARFPHKERTHKALNAVIQGTAADINKLVLVEVYRERKALGLTMRLTVHDELDCDIDPAQVGAVRTLLNTQYVPTKVPILWDVGTGATWADAK